MGNLNLNKWSELEKNYPLNDEETFGEKLAKANVKTLTPILLYRSEAFKIPNEYWPVIEDPKYDNLSKKKIMVSHYLAATVYIAHARESDTKTIDAGQSFDSLSETEITSISKTLFKNSTELKTLIKGDVGGTLGSLKASLSAELQEKVNFEYSTERISSKKIKLTEKMTIPTADYTRTMVPWTISKLLLVYRIKLDGDEALISAEEQYNKTVIQWYKF